MFTFRRTPATSTLAICFSSSTTSRTLPGMARHISLLLRPRSVEGGVPEHRTALQLDLFHHQLVAGQHVDVARPAARTEGEVLRLGLVPTAAATDPGRHLVQFHGRVLGRGRLADQPPGLIEALRPDPQQRAHADPDATDGPAAGRLQHHPQHPLAEANLMHGSPPPSARPAHPAAARSPPAPPPPPPPPGGSAPSHPPRRPGSPARSRPGTTAGAVHPARAPGPGPGRAPWRARR